MDRRKFISRFTSATLGGAGLLGLLGMARVTLPDTSGSRNIIRIGRPDDFPLHTFTLLKDKGLFIFRDNICVKAVSATCTHLGCRLNRIESGFRCPCHGSLFDKRGVVLSGPAPRNLDWWQIEFSNDNQMIVFPDKKVSPDSRLVL